MGLETWKGSIASEMRLIWSEPGCEIAQISDKRLGAGTKDEVAPRVEGAFPLPMGMKGEGRCE